MRATGDVLAILEEAAAGLWPQRPSVQRSRALTYLAATAARVLEAHELERRLVALEDHVHGR